MGNKTETERRRKNKTIAQFHQGPHECLKCIHIYTLSFEGNQDVANRTLATFCDSAVGLNINTHSHTNTQTYERKQEIQKDNKQAMCARKKWIDKNI